MVENDKINKEREELNLLNNDGVKFTIEVDQWRWFRRIRKPRVFEIKQPTLAVLDLLSAEAIEVVIDEDAVAKNPIGESKKILARSIVPVSRYIAIAILGRSAEHVTPFGYCRNDLKINKLASLIRRSMTPKQIKELMICIINESNLVDFIYSIRLIAEGRSTAPSRIEE